MYFFHIRRFDGFLERDHFGLDLSASDLLREADAGARGLLIESIADRTSSSYRRFEVSDACGSLVLIFDFATVLDKIECAQVASHLASMQAAGQGQPADSPVVLVDDVQASRFGIPAELLLVAQDGSGRDDGLAAGVVDIVKLDTLAIENIAAVVDVEKVGGHCAPPGFTSVGGESPLYSTQSKVGGS